MKQILSKYFAAVSFSWIKSPILRILLVFIRVYLVMGLILYFFQEAFIFQPGSGDWQQCETLRKKGGVAIDLKDEGNLLRAWQLPHPTPKARVYIFHGNGGYACGRTYLQRFFSGSPYEFIFVEYPGYDDTDMDYSSLIQRGVNLYDHLQKKSPLPSIAIGESIGTGLATYLARKRYLKGLLLISAYPTLWKIGEKTFPMYPVEDLLKYPLPAEEWARDVGVPVLLLHGDKDRIIPLELGQEQAGNFESNQLIVIKGASHNNWIAHLTGEDVLTMKAYVKKALRDKE